jgi:hypothetical protein
MKKTNITLSIALAAVFSSSVAFAEAEVTGKIVHESASFTNPGMGIGAATDALQTADSHGQDVFKSETSARIYIDGAADQVTEGATYHVELQAFTDGEGVGKFDSNEEYTQRDALREAYIDAETNGFDIRFGKQQVVWGTADGMKLLDAINPTDYAEMAQNQMEDSRIPVWMINAETDTDNGNWQFIVSEGKSSHFAGMGNSSATKATSHSISDQGQAFVMKGADTITGQVNGFLNLAPGLGAAAAAFNAAVAADSRRLTPYTTETVGHFADSTNSNTSFEGTCDQQSTAQCLADIVNLNAASEGLNAITGSNNQHAQNLIRSNGAQDSWDTTNPDTLFEYLAMASFSTFDSFVDMTTSYVVDHEENPTLALRYKNSTSDGLNYSINAIRGNDTNPYVQMQWEKDDGTKLYENIVDEGTTYSTLILAEATSGATVAEVGGKLNHSSTVAVANLKMTEKLNPITQIGGSFDTAIETAAFGPIVLRGEALYQNGVMSPIVTRKDISKKDLEHGFLVSSVVMEKGDRFKYVLGADITALTNMMVSFQFIQDVNLDYVDSGSQAGPNWKYTADMATMHITNGLNKGNKTKEFYSLFLSKPFGASGEHRWNNIFMFEENGGMWNRLDAEFSIDDDTQMTAEWNNYAGDPDTQFGQLANSSNIQVGVKYSF